MDEVRSQIDQMVDHESFLLVDRQRRAGAECEAKMRRLFDSSIIGIVTFDFEGRFIDANDAFLQMVGYSRDGLISGQMRWTDMTPSDWRAVSEQQVADLQATGTRQAFEKE